MGKRSGTARATAAVLGLLATPVLAGTVTGRVEVAEKGRALADLSDVVVYLDGVPRRPSPAHATIRMKGKTFSPHVVAVAVGGTVHFPNDDPILHNAFSVSRPNAFDLKLYKRPKTGAFTFHHPGVVRVYCNIHPQMSAVVLVRDNPFYVMAGRDGTFTLPGVPPGSHTLKAWHERGGEAAVMVNVPAQGSVNVPTLRLDASRFRRIRHKRKDGSEYGRDDY